MDTTTGTGDQGIGSSTGTGADFVITFTQGAGIVNPKAAQDAQTAADSEDDGTKGALTVTSNAETSHTAIRSAMTEITSFTKFD
jgi:hypothetical protein